MAQELESEANQWNRHTLALGDETWRYVEAALKTAAI